MHRLSVVVLRKAGPADLVEFLDEVAVDTITALMRPSRSCRVFKRKLAVKSA